MLEIWTIYDHPLDFPNSFVARKFVLDKPTDEILIAATLPAVREMIQNLSNNPAVSITSPTIRIQRWPDDDPKIVERWAMNLTYSYSLDEEHFDGGFETDVAAAESAFKNNPDYDSVSIGVNTPYAAQDFINGRLLLEIIGEEAFDTCGEPAFDWLVHLQEDIIKLAEFEKLIGDWLELNAPVAFFTVDEIKKINRS